MPVVQIPDFSKKSGISSSPKKYHPMWRLGAIAYINEHLEKNLTITEIAETVGMSPYHFARAFKQSTGIPPHRYLVERRIERAKILLSQTDLSVAQIATRVGFATPSHFTTVFRKHLKTTPNAYRRSL